MIIDIQARHRALGERYRDVLQDLILTACACSASWATRPELPRSSAGGSTTATVKPTTSRQAR